MSSPPGRPPAPGGDRWRAALPELVIAAIAVIAASLAAAAVSGWPGAVTVAIATAVIALLVLRALIPRSAAQALRLKRDRQRAAGPRLRAAPVRGGHQPVKPRDVRVGPAPGP